MTRWVRSVERRVAAPADRLYALVADPRRHPDFDGSGGLVTALRVSTDRRPLTVGDHFDMDMNLRGRYVMTSTIIEAEPGRRFAWQSRPHHAATRWRHIFGGRIWRYEFEPALDGTTLVRESWDLTEEPLRLLMFTPAREAAAAGMSRSLARLAELTERA